MWEALGYAARTATRFVRRHRRAIVVGGVVGAAACAYYRMKRAMEEAEEAHQGFIRQAGEDSRYRQCLTRTRGECAAAVTNFIPTLRKRLFLVVDVTGPVRELKALRRAAATGAGGSESGGSGGGRAAASDGSATAEAVDVGSREVELWEKVKVTALTRLVVALYAFNALALMLYMQLHILGRRSFEESQELLRRSSAEKNASPSTSGTSPFPFPTTVDGGGAAHAGNSSSDGTNAIGVGAEGGRAGTALSVEVRRALLSSTFEHVLGGGLRELVRDVERAVARCTSSWHAHTRQEVGFKDLVTVLRRVRLEVEDGGMGGTTGFAADDGRDGCSRQSSGETHALLLRYIINPSTDGLEMEQRGGLGGDDDGSATPSASRSSGGVSTQQGDESLRGLADVLNETWDTAESPNFAAALQSCLDASFGMVYEQLRQKAFCRGGRQRETARGNDNSPAGSEATGVVGEGADDGPGGGRAATSPDEQVEGVAATPEAPAAATAVAAPMTACGVSLAADEREGFTQVLATVISQAKLVVSEVVEPSTDNEYAQVIAALPAVQDLCYSVFSSNRGIGNASQPSLQPTAPVGVMTPLATMLEQQERVAAVIGRGNAGAAMIGVPSVPSHAVPGS